MKCPECKKGELYEKRVGEEYIIICSNCDFKEDYWGRVK